MDVTDLFQNTVSMPMLEEAKDLEKYEQPKRISWARLIDKAKWPSDAGRKAHVGTVYGDPAWSDGFMLEISEVPEQLKKLKGYFEMRGTPKQIVEGGEDDKPREFDGLVPDLPPDARAVVPLVTIKANGYRKEGVFMGDKPDIVYLAEIKTFLDRTYLDGRAICLQKKYVDYFRIRYRWAEFVMIHRSSPLVVKDKGKTVGVIMPIFVSDKVIEECSDFMWEQVPPRTAPPPPAPPVAKPPPGVMTVAQAEESLSLRTLQQMAREANLSPVGTKVHLIKTLMRKGVLK